MEQELLHHWRAMVRAARPLVGSDDDAQDCAAEAIAQFLERRPDVANLEAFLVTVAKRRAVDRVRARSRAAVREERVARQLAAAEPDVAEEIAARGEAAWAAAEAQRLLSPPSFELLRLVAEGVPVHDIAARLGIKEHAVESRLLRARRTLRAGLARGLAALGLGTAGVRRWLTPAGASTAAVAAAFVLALLELPRPAEPVQPAAPHLQLLPEIQRDASARRSSHGAQLTSPVARMATRRRSSAELLLAPPEATVQTPVLGLSLERHEERGRSTGPLDQVQRCVENLRVEVGYQGCEPPP